MQFGIIGSGSWGTAIAKILVDNGQYINWWIRTEEVITDFAKREHNPQYLQAARFNMKQLHLTTDLKSVVESSDVIIIAIPSMYVEEVLEHFTESCLKDKIIISAIKGMLPEKNILLNEYLLTKFNFKIENYLAVLGPCHAEEVAAERLSYLTFSGVNEELTTSIAQNFITPYTNVVINKDIYGVQYAAVLKNIYAVGAGICHGLGYGDNFLSVLIANAADEMAGFLRKAGILNAEVGYIEHEKDKKDLAAKHHNYAASVYLGDLLVTCYSLHSRNRSFGNMIGKGYSVQAAKLEMSMVAEGYNASRCMHMMNEKIKADMPIAKAIYNILWEQALPKTEMEIVEKQLV